MIGLEKDLIEQGMDFSINYPDLSFRCSNSIADAILKPCIRPPWFETIRASGIALVPMARRELRRTIDRNRTVIATILRRADATTYLDSAKNNNRVLYFHRYASDIAVKAIWLKRDGRGICNSIMTHYSVGMERAIQRWSVAQDSIYNTLKHIPSANVLTMFYEDLCADPHAKLGEACRFLNLDVELMPDEFRADGLHLTGNNMRLKGLSEIRQDTKWRDKLTSADLELFARKGGALNRQLGYAE